MYSPRLFSTNLYGPVPIGFSCKSFTEKSLTFPYICLGMMYVSVAILFAAAALGSGNLNTTV